VNTRSITGHTREDKDRKCLNRVRRLSGIAADDAEQIIQATGQDLEIRLGPELYVERDIEKDVHARLRQAERVDHPLSLLITGEAGHGKTSLLWRLHQTLLQEEKWEPWLIKSTLLSLAPQEGETIASGRLHLDDLFTAARTTRSEDRRPIILLDTVDVLLHGEQTERDALVERLLALSEGGCSLIATCRPQEALLLGPLRKGSLRLNEYRGGELTEAIDKHVAYFYAHTDLRTREEHRNHITSVVAHGMPLREVCINPLTLRMMFTLYAPNPVPPEINVFDLYDKFWQDRVVTDRRAGSLQPDPGAADLRKTTALTALVMLAEGRPELPAQRTHDGVLRCGGADDEIEMLVARGVLHQQSDGTLHFFHQTFFEHSAARGILDNFGVDGLSLIQRRLAKRPHDLFLSPIYEQALLLAENKTSAINQRAEVLLAELFRAASPIERSSGAYVYAHKKSVSPELSRQFHSLLHKADSALIVRFLTVAPNLSTKRLPDLFHELDLIWSREQWDERAHVLDLLERLVVRDHQRTLDFLAKHQVYDYILTLPLEFQGATRLLRVYAALAVHQPERSWELIANFYRFGVKENNQDLKVSAIRAFADFATFYGRENVATNFEATA